MNLKKQLRGLLKAYFRPLSSRNPSFLLLSSLGSPSESRLRAIGDTVLLVALYPCVFTCRLLTKSIPTMCLPHKECIRSEAEESRRNSYVAPLLPVVSSAPRTLGPRSSLISLFWSESLSSCNAFTAQCSYHKILRDGGCKVGGVWGIYFQARSACSNPFT